MAKVSAVVPIYNVEEYLAKNLESLHRQNYDDFEVLCINDGSLDNSQKIIDEYVKKDNRFKSYIKENGGLSDARNYGLDRCGGEYVMFIDGDDFVEEDMIESCVKRMEDDNLDVFVFAYNQYYLERNEKEFISLGIKDGIYNLKDDKSILAYTPNAAWNKMYRKDLFIDNDIRYPFGYRHQDLGTTAKLLYLAKKVGYENKAYYNYLIDRPNNITRMIDDKIYHIIDMCKEIVEFYQTNHYFDEVYDELAYLVNINFIQSLKKAMKLEDKNFVYKFIDSIFDFKKTYFPRKTNKYNPLEEKSYIVYMHRQLCKLYYLYYRRKNRG